MHGYSSSFFKHKPTVSYSMFEWNTYVSGFFRTGFSSSKEVDIPKRNNKDFYFSYVLLTDNLLFVEGNLYLTLLG